MWQARSFAVRLVSVIFLGAAAVAAQVNVASLADDGWYSDDTRADGSGTKPAGTNLVSPVLTDNPEATATGSSTNDADIFGQLLFGAAPGAVPAGTWGGAAHLFIDAIGGGSGKAQISHRKDDASGHAPGTAFGPGFTATYSWMGNGPSSMTASLKFGIKTSDWATTPVSARTGENAWDKLLIYEPGNGNGTLSDSLWHTHSITHTSGTFWIVDRKVGANTIGSPMTLSAMAGNATVVGSTTVGAIWTKITAPGARITSVQFGIGSGNPGASVYVNQLQTSAYLANAKVTFGSPALVYDQNVTPNAIFGSGNVNGSYTVQRNAGVELGMRAKQRFPSANIFNSNGDGSYTFHTGTGGAALPNSEWCFEWSVNTDFDGSNPGVKVGNLTYEIGMDNDPSPGVNYLVFDPITAGSVIPYTAPVTVPFWDHSMGDNSTPNGGGLEATSAPQYAGYLTTYNVAQNSWRPTFYQNTAPYAWNPNVAGRFEYYLAAFSGGDEVGRTHITVVVEPPVTYDQNVTPDVIFGGGNVNGSFTMTRLAGLELAMRAKQRFPSANIFNSNGDGTYTWNTGSGSGSFPNSEWSFEWAVNTDYDGSMSSREVGDLNYRIGMDNDPGSGTNYLVFDPISMGSVIPYTAPVTVPFWDHSMGDNTFTNGTGLEATSAPQYAGYLALYNVAQNSWRPTFYQNTAPYTWNPNVAGRYEYYLAALNGTTELARSAISIIATNGPSLILEADTTQSDQDLGMAGVQIKVRLYTRNLGPAAVTGYQAFLAFSTSELTYVGASSSYSASPFPTHVQGIATANVSPGELRLDGSNFAGSTLADSLLATLVFTVASECSSVDVDFDLDEGFPSELSSMGVPVVTALIDSSDIVADATPPVMSAAPDITVSADAGVGSSCASAVVNYATPAATDNCGDVTVSCYPPSGTTFPAGTTTPVTCVATDSAGNTSMQTFDVTVTLTNKVQVTVQLVGVSTAPSRCIRFQMNSCAAVTDVTLAFDGAGLYTGTIEVPCGNWSSICAKDRQHTKWATSRVSLSGVQWLATTTLALDGGDTDDDGDVDIHDVTWLIAQFGGAAASGGCPYNGTTRDADFSNNTVVASEDYAFLVANWLTTSSCSCALTYVPPTMPTLGAPSSFLPVRDSISAAADLNGDRWVDYRDVQAFEEMNGFDHQLSEAMRASQESGH